MRGFLRSARSPGGRPSCGRWTRSASPCRSASRWRSICYAGHSDSGPSRRRWSLPAPREDAGRRSRSAIWVITGVLPTFVLLYMGYPIFLEHYALLVVPSVAVLVVLGGRALEAAWPRARRPIAAAFAVGLVALCVTV